MSYRFQILSKINRLILNNNKPFKTNIFYQIGKINNKISIRFYKNHKIAKTIILNKEIENSSTLNEKDLLIEIKNNIWQIIKENGGQLLTEAHYQREQSLSNIVKEYFRRKNFICIEQPKLENSKPDLLVKKRNNDSIKVFIELKAYFGKTFVGEPEIAQLLKYYHYFKNNNDSNSKFFLITTGILIKNKENLLLNKNFMKLNIEEKIEQVNQKYKKYIKQLKFNPSLEMRDTKRIYKFSFERFKKNYKDEIFSVPKLYRLTKPIPLEKLIESESEGYSNADIFLIPAYTFINLLELENMQKEKELFIKIRNTWIEDLIFDRNIIKFP